MNSIRDEINALVKKAVQISPDNKSFVLDKGETVSHAVKAHKKMFPGSTITSSGVLSANGIDAKRYMAGKRYLFGDVSFEPFSTPDAQKFFSPGLAKLLNKVYSDSVRNGILLPTGKSNPNYKPPRK